MNNTMAGRLINSFKRATNTKHQNTNRTKETKQKQKHLFQINYSPGIHQIRPKNYQMHKQNLELLLVKK